MTISLEGITEEELFLSLPQGVALNIKNLNTAGGDFDTVGALLANTPALGVSLKGLRWKANLWQAVKSEFHSFLCTESDAYADLRSDWDGMRQKSSTLLISALSAAIGAKLGVASGVLVPLVVWLLVSALRIGKQALCVTLAPPSAGPNAGLGT